MKRINILIVFLLTFYTSLAQNQQAENKEETLVVSDFLSFGEQIDANGAISTKKMSEKYQNLTISDTLSTKFSAIVTDVCQAKGCWMKLKLEDGQETMVRFKAYGFFMPMDIKGKEVIVNGHAFVEELSVDEQKHYAKDGGKSEEEINQIALPKKSFGFTADGVLLKQ